LTFSPWDITFIVIVLIMAFRGAFRGFLTELTTFGSLILGVILGFLFSPAVGRVLDLLFEVNPFNRAFGFVIVFLAVALVLAIVKYFLKEWLESMELESMDKTLGLAVGAIEGIALTYMLLLFLYSQPFWELQAEISQGVITGPLLQILPPSLFNG
jgi:uncharacterized membrane protein required for colicin V production